jgi:hypothetical protein
MISLLNMRKTSSQTPHPIPPLTINLPHNLLLNNHLRTIITRNRARIRRRPSRTPRIMANMRLILAFNPKIVQLTLTLLRASGSPLLSARSALRAFHGAESVAALFARPADLRAGDDGFVAHGAEAGEERGEERAQAGDCGGHYCVEDFGLAADGGGDAVEGLVG